MTPEHEAAYWLHRARLEDRDARRAAMLGHWMMARLCKLRAAEWRRKAERCMRAPWWRRAWARLTGGGS